MKANKLDKLEETLGKERTFNLLEEQMKREILELNGNKKKKRNKKNENNLRNMRYQLYCPKKGEEKKEEVGGVNLNIEIAAMLFIFGEKVYPNGKVVELLERHMKEWAKYIIHKVKKKELLILFELQTNFYKFKKCFISIITHFPFITIIILISKSEYIQTNKIRLFKFILLIKIFIHLHLQSKFFDLMKRRISLLIKNKSSFFFFLHSKQI